MKQELAEVGLTSWLREKFSVAGRLDQYRFDMALVWNGDGTAEQLIERWHWPKLMWTLRPGSSTPSGTASTTYVEESYAASRLDRDS